MWELFHVLQSSAYFFGVVAGLYWLKTDLWPNHIGPFLGFQKIPSTQEKRLRANGRTIHTEEPDPKDQLTYGPISIKEARAGNVITELPKDRPDSKSWTETRKVVATALARIFTPQGVHDTLFIWLTGDRMLMKTPKKWWIFTELPITSQEATSLLMERESLLNDVKSGDSTPDQHISNFRGSSWTINGAYGRNENGRTKEQSTIELTSILSDLGEFEDDVPAMLVETGRPVAYFDMRADDPKENRRMLVMWPEEGSDCIVYMGRELESAEVKQMEVA